MSRRRIVRAPIVDAQVQEISRDLVHLPTWTPVLGGHRLDLSFLKNQPNGRQLVQGLLHWQEGKRGGYTVGLDARRYLRFVAEHSMTVGSRSLQEFRSKLELDPRLSDGTRASYYSNAVGYVNSLAKQGVVVAEDPPAGFAKVRKAPKRTLAEAARNWEVVKDLPEFDDWLANVASIPNLDKTGREVLAISEGWTALLERRAAELVARQLDDWALSERVTSKCGAGLEQTQHRWPGVKSIECALGCLFETFGGELPPSAKWPNGLVDYCKHKGWPPDRLRAALFPTIKSLDAFLVLALTNSRLAPNVDSVLYYAFVGCVTPTDEASSVRVCFGKFRGRGPDSVLDAREPIVRALQALEAKVKRALSGLSPRELANLSKDGGVPLFLHRYVRGGRSEIRPVDPGMAAYMVRRFVTRAAEVHTILRPMVGGVTGENFRPTHLLCSRLRGDSVFAIQAKARHKDVRTTAGYLERVEVESSAMRRFADYQRYLVDESKAERMRRLGNGFLCDEEASPRDQCVRTDACGMGAAGCSARRIFLGSPMIVAEWIAWASHIRSREPYLRIHRAERWEGVWAPRLLEYEVLLEQVPTAIRLEATALTPSITLLPIE